MLAVGWQRGLIECAGLNVKSRDKRVLKYDRYTYQAASSVLRPYFMFALRW
jgi:hypothetical protein